MKTQQIQLDSGELVKFHVDGEIESRCGKITGWPEQIIVVSIDGKTSAAYSVGELEAKERQVLDAIQQEIAEDYLSSF